MGFSDWPSHPSQSFPCFRLYAPGGRRVTLFFVWTGICLAPVFPLVPWFWPLLLLQIVNGGALSFAWSGSQTLIAQLAEDSYGHEVVDAKNGCRLKARRE